MNKSLAQCDIQDIVSMLCRLEKYPDVQVIFNGMSSFNGLAYYNKGIIKIADSVFDENESYWTAVAVHETCHFFNNRWHREGLYVYADHHGNVFKQFEIKYLSLFGMRPIYKKAYWKYLIDEETEEILWTTWKDRPNWVSRFPDRLREE